ncbi:MAG: HupE/UreJ family protein [Rhodothermia bacterium]|nr:HupE/UreJ family protein [Rhodothermia bacterium]
MRRSLAKVACKGSVLAALAVSLLAPLRAEAHNPGQSYILVEILDSSMVGHFDIMVSDLNRVLNLNLSTEGDLTEEDLLPHLNQIHAYYRDHVRFHAGGQLMPYRFTGIEIHDVDFGQFVYVHFALEAFDQLPARIDVNYSAVVDIDEDHRGFLAIKYNWKAGTFGGEQIALIFSSDSQLQTLDLSDNSIWRGFVAVVKLGIWHIWIGIDHILFLVALIIPAVTVRREREWHPVDKFTEAAINVVKIVTVFTLAHSVTLSLAALNVVNIPGRIVEPIIAVSIAAAALDIFYPIFGKRIWIVVFVFGLFHGFGFAGVLGEIGVTRDHLVPSLLGFNLGVEIGQVAIIALAFPVLFMLAKREFYTKWAMQLGAVLLIAISMLWFLERTFEFNVPLAPMAKQLFNLFLPA